MNFFTTIPKNSQIWQKIMSKKYKKLFSFELVWQFSSFLKKDEDLVENFA